MVTFVAPSISSKGLNGSESVARKNSFKSIVIAHDEDKFPSENTNPDLELNA